MQIVCQDPYASLDPRLPISEIVGEGLSNHGMKSRRRREEAVADILEKVGLRRYYINRYPHEFSGGQRQRVRPARAPGLPPQLGGAPQPVAPPAAPAPPPVLQPLAPM